MNRLEGKVAFITGGGSGIGRATARMFAAEGAKVAIADFKADLGAAAVAEITAGGGDALAVHTDITKEDQVKEAVEATIARYGRIDILFNCAGGSSTKDTTVVDVDLSLWKDTMELDLLGTFLCCRHVVPHMISQSSGVIINMATWGAMRGANPKHIYVAAKGAIISLTRALAGEYSHNGIRANAISPGSVKTTRSVTNMANNLKADPNNKLEARRKFLADNYPFSVGSPEDIAYIAVFLASNESRMITGATIPADGGRSAF